MKIEEKYSYKISALLSDKKEDTGKIVTTNSVIPAVVFSHNDLAKLFPKDAFTKSQEPLTHLSSKKKYFGFFHSIMSFILSIF